MDAMVFGSFAPAHLTVLDGVVATMRERGYDRFRRVASTPTPKSDAEIFRECTDAASRAQCAVFIFFNAGGEPNQSVGLELQARNLRLQNERGVAVNATNTLIVIQDGTPARALLRGLAAENHITLHEWREEPELRQTIGHWLLSATL